MVKILNGEIVQDNDPRVRQRSLSNASLTSSTSHSNSPFLSHNTSSPHYSSTSSPSFYGYSTNNTANNNNLNVPPHHLNNNYGHSPYLSPYHSTNFASSAYNTNNNNSPPHITPFSLSQGSDHYNNHYNTNPSSRSIFHSTPNPPSSSFPSATLHHPNTFHSAPQYSLFGLPPVFIYDLCIPPHLYLPTILLLYLIGPPSLLAILPAFMFYRWHLLREAEKAARERTLEKFLPFKDAKTRNRLNSSTIHTITDWQQSSSSSPVGM
jgi:hypothetical protein